MYNSERNVFTKNLYLLAEAVTYMENEFTRPLKISELAHRAHLSERHFTRVFKQNYHIAPMERVM